MKATVFRAFGFDEIIEGIGYENSNHFLQRRRLLQRRRFKEGEEKEIQQEIFTQPIFMVKRNANRLNKFILHKKKFRVCISSISVTVFFKTVTLGVYTVHKKSSFVET